MAKEPRQWWGRGCATLSGNRSCGAETVAFSKKSEFYKKAHQEMK